MDRGEIIQEIGCLALNGGFDSVSFPFMGRDYTVTLVAYDCGEVLVDVECFPDYDGDVPVSMFNDEFLWKFFRAILEKSGAIDKNLF